MRAGAGNVLLLLLPVLAYSQPECYVDVDDYGDAACNEVDMLSGYGLVDDYCAASCIDSSSRCFSNGGSAGHPDCNSFAGDPARSHCPACLGYDAATHNAQWVAAALSNSPVCMNDYGETIYWNQTGQDPVPNATHLPGWWHNVCDAVLDRPSYCRQPCTHGWLAVIDRDDYNPPSMGWLCGGCPEYEFSPLNRDRTYNGETNACTNTAGSTCRLSSCTSLCEGGWGQGDPVSWHCDQASTEECASYDSGFQAFLGQLYGPQSVPPAPAPPLSYGPGAPAGGPYGAAMGGYAYNPGNEVPTCGIEMLRVAGFRITTDTSDDSESYFNGANGTVQGDEPAPLTDELGLCEPCDPSVTVPDRFLVLHLGFPYLVFFVAVTYSCLRHRDIWSCTEQGQEDFRPLGLRPSQPGDALLKPIRKDAKLALAEHRYDDLVGLAQQMQSLETNQQVASKETETVAADATTGAICTTLEVSSFVVHLMVFGVILFLALAVWTPTGLKTDLTLEECNSRPSPILQIESPCPDCPDISCDPCQSMLRLYPMCDVAYGAVTGSPFGTPDPAMAGMMGTNTPRQVPQHLEVMTECSPCLEQAKCQRLEAEERAKSMDLDGMTDTLTDSMGVPSTEELFGEHPSFIERFALVQADMRPANCNVQDKDKTIIWASVLTVFFMCVALGIPSCLPIIVLVARTITKLAIAAALLQPTIMPNRPESTGDDSWVGNMALEALQRALDVCAVLGVLVAIYAIFRFIFELKQIKVPNAVMRMIRPAMTEHSSSILKMWIPFAAINFVVVTLWNLAESPLKNLVACADLCSSVPSLLRTFVPIFWFISSFWTSSFITKMLYTRVSKKLLQGEETGLNAFDIGNIAVAAIVNPTVELIWTAMSAPFSNIPFLYGANWCCCFCETTPARRSLLRYEAVCLNRYQNFVLWRSVKDGLGFHDAALTQHADWAHAEKYAALDCRQDTLVCSVLSGIPFVIGSACAAISLMSCESKQQATECFVTGNLIGSVVVIPVEAAIDHVFGSMDDNIEDFVGSEDFANLVSIETFAAIDPNRQIEVPMEPADPPNYAAFEHETENPVAS